MPVTTTTIGPGVRPDGTDADDEIRVEARSKVLLVAGIGAVAVSNNGGIAGSFALNELTQTVKAFVRNAAVTTHTLTVSASGEDDVIAVAAGVSGQAKMSQSGFTVAGSVTLNRLTHDISRDARRRRGRDDDRTRSSAPSRTRTSSRSPACSPSAPTPRSASRSSSAR